MRKLAALLLCLTILFTLLLPVSADPGDEATEPQTTEETEPLKPGINSVTAHIPSGETISDELIISANCPREIVLQNVAIQGKLIVEADHAVTIRFEGNSFANEMELHSNVRLIGGNHGAIVSDGPGFSLTGGSADSITLSGDGCSAAIHAAVPNVTLSGKNIRLTGSGSADTVKITASGCQVNLPAGSIQEEIKTDFTDIAGVVTVDTPTVSPKNSVVKASVTFTNVPKAQNCTLQWFVGDILVYTDWNFSLETGKTSTMAYSTHFDEDTPESIPVFVQLTSNTNRDDQKRIVGRVLTECKRQDYYDSLEGVEKPFKIDVYRDKCIIVVWGLDENGEYTDLVNAFPCSVGVLDKSPKGSYNTDKLYRWTMLYGEVYGQYCTHITTKYLFHSVPYYSQSVRDLEWDQYNRLGSPASAGCIRLSCIDAKWIYDHCPLGTQVNLFNYADKFGKNTELPLEKPIAASINTSSRLRGWDPTDPDPANPTKAVNPPMSEALAPACVEVSRITPA